MANERSTTNAALVAAGLFAVAIAVAAMWLGPTGTADADSTDQLARDAADGIEPAVLSEDQAEAAYDRAASAATPEQVAAFGDSVVTLDEYRSAVDAERACLAAGLTEAAQEHGIGGVSLDLHPVSVSPDGFRLDYLVSVDGDVPDELQGTAMQVLGDVSRDCHMTHVNEIRAAFQANFRADSEAMAEAAAGLRACLETGVGEDQGMVGVPTDTDQLSLYVREALLTPATNSRVLACSADYPSFFDVTTPEGE